MSTTNQLSTNTYEILYNSSDTPTSILTALKEIFTAKGFTSLNAGAITTSGGSVTIGRPLGAIPVGGILSLASTLLNSDGSSSKPVVAEVTTLTGVNVLQLCTAESVSLNSLGYYNYLNAPWMQFSGSSAGFINLTGFNKQTFNRIFVFASSRYVALQHKSDAGVLSEWHGVFEIAREFSGNNVALGVPTHGLMSSFSFRANMDGNASLATVAGNPSYASISATLSGPLNLCRTRNGATAQLASCGTRIITSLGEVGIQGVAAVGVSTGGVLVVKRFHDVMPSLSNPWNGKNWASNLGVITDNDQAGMVSNGNSYVTLLAATSPSYMGKIYGLKSITSSIGSTLDQISMPIDANGFLDAGGTPTTHYVLGGPGVARFVLPQ